MGPERAVRRRGGLALCFRQAGPRRERARGRVACSSPAQSASAQRPSAWTGRAPAGWRSGSPRPQRRRVMTTRSLAAANRESGTRIIGLRGPSLLKLVSGGASMDHRLRKLGTSAPFPKFGIHLSTLRHELRKQRGTSNSMILVPLFDLKFLTEFAAGCCRNFKSAALVRGFAGRVQQAAVFAKGPDAPAPRSLHRN